MKLPVSRPRETGVLIRKLKFFEKKLKQQLKNGDIGVHYISVLSFINCKK